MTQLDLIIALAERDGITKENATRIVKTFFNSMTDALEKGIGSKYVDYVALI